MRGQDDTRFKHCPARGEYLHEMERGPSEHTMGQAYQPIAEVKSANNANRRNFVQASAMPIAMEIPNET